MILSGQFFNLSEISAMSTLSTSFWKIKAIITEELSWLKSQEAFTANNGMYGKFPKISNTLFHTLLA